MKATIEKVDRLFNELDELRPLGDEAKGKLRQKLNIDWNYNSNAIEGSTLTLGETRTFLLHGITAKGKPFRDYIDAEGHDHAIEAVEEVLRGDHPLTQAFTRELHKILLKEPYTIPAVALDGSETTKTVTPGEYKALPNHVKTSTGKTHYYASPEETQAKMNDLFDWYNKQTDTHPLITAAAFHYRFVIIHPFDDGNGRMARLLMNLILMKNGYTPAIIPMERRKEYITLLEQMDEANDIEPFAEFVGECLAESLTLAIKAAKGEELLTPDDFDKRVEMLKQKVQTAKNVDNGPAVSEEKKLINYIKTDLSKFDKFLTSKFNKLGELFKEVDEKSSLNSIKFKGNSIENIMKGMTRIDGRVLYHREFTLAYLKGISKEQHLKITVYFKIELIENKFSLWLVSGGIYSKNDLKYRNIPLELLPSGNVAIEFANAFFQEILSQIENTLRESTQV
jgi:Fic family protein